jgi:hypothetical protein
MPNTKQKFLKIFVSTKEKLFKMCGNTKHKF